MKSLKLLLLFLFITPAIFVNAQDNALSFNSSTTYAQIANSAALNPSSITIEAWINATAWRANYWEGSIINKECDGCPDAGYMLRVGNGGILNFGLSVGAGWTELNSPASLLVTGTWYHVAGVYDGTNMYLYINGVQVASKAQTGSISSNSTPLEIGRMNADNSRYFAGKIDEIRIWNLGLNSAEIGAWYNKTVTACHPKYANLVGYYECNTTTAGVLTATVGANGIVSGATYGLASNASFLGLVSGYQSSTTTQSNISAVALGSTNNELIRIEVEAYSATNATQFILRTNGTTNVGDIANAKLWYSGTSPIFATTTQFGATIVVPPVSGVNMTFAGTQALTCGKNYFWLTYDVLAGATLGDVIDGQCISLNVGGVRTPTVSSPAGNRPIASSCTHTARLTDTYGDGWNGGTITVSVNGVPVLTNITLAAGLGPLDFTFNASSGDLINVTQSTAGSFPSEMRVEVISGTGASILSSTQPLSTPGTNVTGCCLALVPGIATSPVPANNAVSVNPCSLDFSWTAPANTGCNGATSYDFYFGTTAVPPFLLNRTTNTYAIPNALADNTTYYWKIVPKNAAGNAAACPTWSFTTGASPNPLFCMYGNSTNYPLGGANCAQLTPNVGTQNGCVWNRAQVSFASAFDYTVNMYFGASAGGADGAAFVFQNSPMGISQCGNNGGQLGAGGISNAVVIEFDTYDNDWPGHVYDMTVDHTAIEIDGDMQGPGAPLAGPVQADPLDGLIADGLIHVIRITWNPATQLMCVYVDGSLRLSTNYDFVNNVFGGNPNVWWGLTGSTGALANQQYFCPTLIPLPIDLSKFELNCENDFIEINWTTISEKNNDYFTIEKSTDSQNWKVLDNIKGAGNSNDILNYKIIDSNPQMGGSYYRLRQTDFDGKVTYSEVKYFNCNSLGNEISIYPNPCNDIINVKIQNNLLNSETIVSITDIVGKSLMVKTTKNDLISFDLSNFSTGIYFVHLRSNSMTEIRKFVKK
ncbi:MAG: T9SS type A sorting domain-containing protein [Bacteroidetes bacterium]|nr:T9SS type A sorting domain-containing protein [Bacteroidota bacterium]